MDKMVQKEFVITWYSSASILNVKMKKMRGKKREEIIKKNEYCKKENKTQTNA